MFNVLDINEHLDNDEKILLFFRPSRKAYILQYILWIFVLVCSLVLLAYSIEGASSNLFILWKFMEYLSYFILIIAIIMLLRLEYRILSRRYALTSERILYSRGIFQEVFKSLSYSYVTDIEFIQSFWDKIMNTGTLGINTAGTLEYEIRYRKISDPLKVKKMINNMQTTQNNNQAPPQIHKSMASIKSKKGK